MFVGFGVTGGQNESNLAQFEKTVYTLETIEPETKPILSIGLSEPKGLHDI